MTKKMDTLIENIKNGKVPSGYTKIWHLMPEDWKDIPLSYILVKKKAKNEDNQINTVFTNSAVNGIIPQSEYFEKDIANSENTEGYLVVDPLDYVYNPRISESAPFGPFNRNNTGISGIVSPLYTVLSPRDKFKESEYLQYYLRSSQWHKYAYSIANYGARFDRMNITDEELMQLPVIWPSLVEQERIAEILKQCDAVIELYRKKVTELNKLKKACMTKMFPQKDRDNPIIRFKDYSDKWKEYIFGEIYKERNDPGHSGLPILTVSIHSGVSDGELDKEELGKKVKRSEDKTLYKQVCCGDLVLNMMRAWQGAIGVAKCEGMVSPAYITAIPNEYVYPPFMEYCLRTPEIMYQINTLSYGVTDFRKRIYWDSFVRIKCKLPSIEEQKAIADYFMNIDHLIDLYQQNLEQMKKTKTALMQLLFTGIVRVNV